jgi:ABC-type glycerol-3-phosphate transport system substrate-binding protein
MTTIRQTLALACLVVLAAGCSDFSFIAAKEPVTLRFFYPGDPGYYEPLVEAFQRENKNITVELVSPQVVGFQRIGEADVLVVPQFFLTNLIEQGIPIDLSTWIADDPDFSLDAFYPAGVSLLSTEGKRWAIPYMADMLVMVYNRDLFDASQVPYPDAAWTWDGFLDRALRLTHAAEGVFGYAYYQTGQLAMYEPMVFMYQYGGRLFDNLEDPTTLKINDPYNVTGLQLYADLVHRHGVAPGPRDRPAPYPQSGIEAGRYAMWMGWLSEVEGWREDLDVGVAPIPNGPNPVTIGTAYGIAISSQTLHHEAAWAWVRFISQYAPPMLIPLRQSLAELKGARSVDAELSEVGRVSVPRMIGMGLNPEGPLWSKWGIAMQAFSGAIFAIQNGDPVGPALDAAQRKVDF